MDNKQTNDHDVLIRLDTKFDVFINEWQSTRNSLNSRLSAAESRITGVEGTVKELIIGETRKKADLAQQWIHDFQVRWKLIIAISTILGSIVTLLIEALVRFFFH
jgi:hypothetical protein